MQPGFDHTLVSLRAPASFAAEQFQALRLQVERLRSVRDVHVLAISSPGLGDGKTVTAINLAAAHAESERVLLIDADLRRPSIGARLRLSDADASGPGLADALSNHQLELTDLVRQVDDIPFAMVLAGAPSTPVHELLRSPRLDHLLQDARRQFDLVVVDTPPMIPVTDAVVLARALDGVVVVVSANDTPRKLLEESLNLLDASKVLGIVFNRDHRPLYGYYNGDYRTRFAKRRPT